MDAIILSGGRASRMGGVRKAFLRLGAETFIERIIATLRPFFDSIIIAADEPGPYAHLGEKVVVDGGVGRGPLAGLHAGLHASDSEFCFVTTADAPLLEPALVAWMIDHATGCDALVPSWERGIEPLCAVYARSCLPAIEKVLAPGSRVIAFFPFVRVAYVPAEVLRRLDPDLVSFMNVNTPREYEELCRAWEAGPAR
jgi:molybdopterin-guanine dinucleotide biosynthesis protein A